MLRAYLSLGQAEQTLDYGGHAQTQLEDLCLGHGTREVDGLWTTRSRSTRLVDPFEKLRAAIKESELEATRGTVKAE